MNRPLPLATLTLKPSVSQRLSPEALIVLHAIHYDWAPEDVREHKDVCLLQACSRLRRTKRESFLFKSLTTTPWAPAVNTTRPASDSLDANAFLQKPLCQLKQHWVPPPPSAQASLTPTRVPQERHPTAGPAATCLRSAPQKSGHRASGKTGCPSYTLTGSVAP